MLDLGGIGAKGALFSLDGEIIYEEKPIIYLYSGTRIVAIRNKFKNIFPSSLSGIVYNLDEIFIGEGK